MAASTANPPFEIIALASSAGGVNALMELLAHLPKELPVPIVAVQHIDPRHRSLLADILTRHTALRVKMAEEGDSLEAGAVYLAPPDRHLLVTPERTLTLTRTELVHYVRPSADLLFESVAATYHDRAIAVVLTGTGQDSATGVKAIKSMGGTVIVQDQASSEFFGMPSAAIATGDVDYVLSLVEIAPALVKLVTPDD
ncbi:MAG: Chemotaxis response regulator protein-glutamate methylesterase [bacterium ADurb.Bin429]|nr:MAG: Chemotaxis response regulator protein-glutamate methylesterase [bacterium ADurb.Bin429]